jgi:thioredoxin reductase
MEGERQGSPERDRVWRPGALSHRCGRHFEVRFTSPSYWDVLTVGENSNWKWPDIEGLHDFQGTRVHSASWPQEFDYKDKVVAVIGNGASGVQIVPALTPCK